MQTFRCARCRNRVFFENVRCLNCEATLAFSPDTMQVMAVEQAPDGRWHVIGSGSGSDADTDGDGNYRLCGNYTAQNVCNWCLLAEDPHTLCLSCRLTRVIPDLSQDGNLLAWCRLETAKRRALYTLLSLGLAPTGATSGLAFQFLADSVQPNGDRARVLSGHDDGLITVNIAEADDVYREQQRQQQHEPYRTLLGHFRHELGHYYWDRLIKGSGRLAAFRERFGDERADYGQSLQHHYDAGPPADWPERFISAYASMHPWEDWAESWAHVMHMVDALETAHAMQLSVADGEPHDSLFAAEWIWEQGRLPQFETLLEAWGSLTYALNNLTRGLGLPDSYPFLLSPVSRGKLQFVYETVTAKR